MNKSAILIAILVFCLIAWSGTTYLVGGKAQAHYNHALTQYGQWGPLTFTSQSYERGFLESRAETLLELQVPNMTDAEGKEISSETLQVLFEHTFYHGPFPMVADQLAPALAVVETRVVRVSPSEDALEELLKDLPELAETVALVTIDFNGDTSGRFEVPPFARQDDDVQLRWGGLQLNAAFSPGAKTLVGDLVMPEIAVTAEDGALSWQGLRGDFDLVEAFPLVFVGHSKMVSGPMDMAFANEMTGAQETLRLQDFEVTSVSLAEGPLVHYTQDISFRGVTIDVETYGPVVVEVEAKNLDGQVLSEFQQQIYAVYRDASSLSPEELTAQILPLYVDLFAKLLKGNPEFNIRRMQVMTPMGQADAALSVKVSGYQGEPMETIADPSRLLAHVESSAEVIIDEGLVRGILERQARASLAESDVTMSDEEIKRRIDEQLATQLDTLVAQNFITRADGKIRAAGSFNRGELLVNGRPVPLPMNR